MSHDIRDLWRKANSSSDTGSMEKWLERMNLTDDEDLLAYAIFSFDGNPYIASTDRNPRFFIKSFANEYGLELPT